jgi:hypothetical protein
MLGDQLYEEITFRLAGVANESAPLVLMNKCDIPEPLSEMNMGTRERNELVACIHAESTRREMEATNRKNKAESRHAKRAETGKDEEPQPEEH